VDRIARLKKALQERKCVKVISGIANFDLDRVKKVVKAADKAKATAVDIAAKPEIVFEARKLTDIAIFASSVDPKELLMAVKHGADVAELGNFDALYENGIQFSAEKVYELAVETMDLIGDHALVCITVPGHLPVKEQVELAEKLQELGVDMIQTEGAVLSQPQVAGALGLIEKASVTLANTVELAANIKHLPIITASGIGSVTAPMAIAAGASGVGVGKFVNKLSSELEMMAATQSIVNSVNTFRPASTPAKV
jgi:methylmalonyl-CoA mutase cobalamin-binding subunit